MTDAAVPRTRPVVEHVDEVRIAFLKRVYGLLGGAIAAFVLLQALAFGTGLARAWTQLVLSTSWLLVLGGFLLVSWLSTRAAHRVASVPAQLAAYGALVVVEAAIFTPFLYLVAQRADGVIVDAVILTALGFAGLTVVALTSGRDFSVLGAFLKWGFVVALVAIVGAVLFGFQLGTWFSVAMIAFAGAAILYDTSRALHDYPPGREVAASMQLFASVMLLFWYVLRLLSDR